MSLESLLAEDSMTVERKTNTRDTSGGFVQTWATQYSGVPCKWEEPSSNREIRNHEGMLVTRHVIYTQQTGIRNGDRCVSNDGRYAFVVGIRQQFSMGTIDQYFWIDGESIKGGP